MRMKTYLLLAALSTICLGSNGANTTSALPEVKDVLEQCGAHSQAGMRDCLARTAHESAKSLAQAEDKTAALLKRWDEEDRFVVQAAQKLLVSKRAFVEYRDAQCAFAASIGGGAVPNALELRRLVCVYTLNRERVIQLTRLTEDLPAK